MAATVVAVCMILHNIATMGHWPLIINDDGDEDDGEYEPNDKGHNDNDDDNEDEGNEQPAARERRAVLRRQAERDRIMWSLCSCHC